MQAAICRQGPGLRRGSVGSARRGDDEAEAQGGWLPVPRVVRCGRTIPFPRPGLRAARRSRCLVGAGAERRAEGAERAVSLPRTASLRQGLRSASDVAEDARWKRRAPRAALALPGRRRWPGWGAGYKPRVRPGGDSHSLACPVL
eukprot:scaffold5250_cov394-Prasinococcus_capsulatus_cf.AAC.1